MSDLSSKLSGDNLFWLFSLGEPTYTTENLGMILDKAEEREFNNHERLQAEGLGVLM